MTRPRTAVATTLIVMDLDGVVSPVHGRTTWGDDVIVNPAWGGILASPLMCQRLERLADLPGLQFTWLSSWDAEMRSSLSDPFPGRHWPTIADATTAQSPSSKATGEDSWWKWDALQEWLVHNPKIDSIVWCDDHLARPRPTHRTGTYRRIARAWFHAHGYSALLISPRTDRGLTPAHLDQIEDHVASTN